MALSPSTHSASRTVGRIFTASVLGGLALMTVGCFKSEKGPTSAEAESNPGVKSSGKGFPGMITGGVPKTGYYYGKAIAYVEKDGQAYFEGDILLDKAGLRDTPPPLAKSSGFGLPNGQYRWNNGKVYYYINPDIPNPERITNAMSIWSWQTSIQFLPYTEKEWDWIRFKKSNDCGSAIGMQTGEQSIGVADHCNEAAMLHEIGHALGLEHEHSRPDRDQYLTINWDNMKQECVLPYGKVTGGLTWGPLDLYSIMLYPSFMCSVDPNIPVVTTVNGDIIPENTFLSFQDLDLVRKMYPLYLNEAKSSTLARDIGSGATGAAFIITNTSAGSGNYTVRRFNSQASTRWESFTGSGVRIDVDINGRPWVAKANGSVQRWTGSSWVTMGTLGGVKDIGIGVSPNHPYGSVYVLSSAVMDGSNYSLYRWNGSGWTRTSGSGVSISVDPAGLPWTVNAEGQLHRWTGSQWQLMGERYGDVGVGPDGQVYASVLAVAFNQSGLHRKVAPSGSNGSEQERTFFAMSGPKNQNIHIDPLTRVDGGPGETFWTLTADGWFNGEELRGTVDKGTTNYTGPQ